MENQEAVIAQITKEKVVDDATMQTILAQQRQTGQSIVSILKQNNLLNEEQLTKIIAVSQGIEYIDLSSDKIDPMTAHLLTYEMVSRYNVIPVRKEGKKLIVAMGAPLNLSVRDQIEMKTGYEVCPVAASPAAIRQAVNFHFSVRDVTKQTIVSMRLKQEPAGGQIQDNILESKLSEAERESAQVVETPITRLVTSIINGAIDARASDIHLEPRATDMQVRYRIDGLLHDTLNVPAAAQLEVISHIKIMAEMDISEKRVPQDGHISVQHSGRDYDLRVSSLPATGGEKIVIRILDKYAGKWSLDTVVPRQEDNEKFRRLVNNPYGMILLTGPTGCGKTTTLYSVLQLLNNPDVNIVTVEDPVEYRLEGITQVQVRPAAGVTFASSLRSIVRQDPDIILIGEIRDGETAEIAVSAALTGHVVLSTLHTNDAAGAISRLINLNVAPFLVASALLGTVAQRLVRTICKNCKQGYKPSNEELRTIFGKSLPDKEIQFYRGTGCQACRNTGYLGRKGVFEILPVSQQIHRMITDIRSDEDIKQQAIKEGMRTLTKAAIDEVLEGNTTVEELIRGIDLRAD
ncbi:MAG: type II/IV secretion system protein [Sedimentisphaerales bacterium]|nr:type II/IV secretion system protein [Sedimentisphaerales bacterium]